MNEEMKYEMNYNSQNVKTLSKSYLNTDNGAGLQMGTCKVLVPYQWSRKKIVCKLVYHRLSNRVGTVSEK